MKKIKTRFLLILLFILTAGCFFLSLPVSAEKMTHTVKKGDTLWGICEQYYGDTELWPKLWEMNSFITNPHLLVPGDVITLFEKDPRKTPEPEPVVEAEKEPQPLMGIDVKGMTRTDKIGIYSSKNITPWGTLFATAKQNVIMSKGDIAYVIFEKNRKISAGDEFLVGKITKVRHPVTGKKAGSVFNPSGRFVVLKETGTAYHNKKYTKKENVYEVKITGAYSPVETGDVIVPPEFIPTCILPASNSTDILGNIVAGAENVTLIHKFSVFYMDKGSSDGIKSGNIFEIRKGNIVKDPKPQKVLKIYEEELILPDQILGKALVIKTYANEATAVVISATEPISPGAYLKSVSWTETPEFVSVKADCPVK